MSRKSKAADLSLLIASALWVKPRDPDALALAFDLIESGGGEALFDALMDDAKVRGDDSWLREKELADLFKTMLDEDPRVATYLAARLCARSKYHEFSSSFGAWTESMNAPGVADMLTLLATEGASERLKEAYRSWAKFIEEKAAKAHGPSDPSE
jgi:hypothetical protein